MTTPRTRPGRTGLAAALLLAASMMLPACAGPPSRPAPPLAGDRLLPTQGSLNTRDIGGYRTADGRTVLNGKIYRSSALSYLTPDDLRLLRERDITTVVDFRSPTEAARAPDKLPPGARSISAPILPDKLDQHTVDQLLDQDHFSPAMHNAELVDSHGPFYRMLTLVNSYGRPAFVDSLSAYKPLFDSLRDPNRSGSLLMHCTGGRDRTGIATALLLRTLGVSPDRIEQDYLASNANLQPDGANPESTAFEKFDFSSVYLQPTSNEAFQRVAAQLSETPQHLYDAVKLRPELLTVLFATIDARYGSFDNFLAQRLGITSTDVTILRNKYTQ